MLFPVPEGADPSLAYERAIEQQESGANPELASASARLEIERIASVLKTWRPGLREFRPKAPLPWIELTDESLQLQFQIYDGSVSVTIPYFRDRAQEMMATAPVASSRCARPRDT